MISFCSTSRWSESYFATQVLGHFGTQDFESLWNTENASLWNTKQPKHGRVDNSQFLRDHFGTQNIRFFGSLQNTHTNTQRDGWGGVLGWVGGWGNGIQKDVFIYHTCSMSMQGKRLKDEGYCGLHPSSDDARSEATTSPPLDGQGSTSSYKHLFARYILFQYTPTLSDIAPSTSEMRLSTKPCNCSV